MQNTVALSIIIPVYNVADTLDRCVESVVAALSDDMEVILVDDGSTDGSGQLCDQWSAKDRRISVIHQRNGGLSDARNRGIAVARGSYLTFVDSDDYIDSDTYAQLMGLLADHPDYDLLEFPVNRHEGSPRERLLTFENRAYSDMSLYWYGTQAYDHCYAWNKIYRRQLFDEVRFPVGKVFEDTYTLPHLLRKAARVATTDRGLYHYCHNSRGITVSADGRAWQMLLDANMQIADMPEFTAYNDAAYYLQLLNIQLMTSELTGCRPVVREAPQFKNYHIKTRLVHLIGIENLCKANRLFRTIFRRRS